MPRRAEVVIDTNVLVAALRSRNGASFRLLSLLGVSDRFRVHVSVPLVLEYAEVLTRQAHGLGLTAADVDTVVDGLCDAAMHHEIHFLWRPLLKDASDDMVLELAVEASCDAIVTFNKRDFAGADRFGIRVIGPLELLREIGEVP